MSEREILELAALAAGREIVGWHGGDVNRGTVPGLILAGYLPVLWNPLEDDGDALRLLAKLKLKLYFGEMCAIVSKPLSHAYLAQDTSDDLMAATRRAVTMAAAEIGKTMKGGA